MKTDKRITDLARIIVNHSLEVKKGEFVYIDINGLQTKELGAQLIYAVQEAGAIPYWHVFDDMFTKPFFKNADKDQHYSFATFHQAIMDKIDAYVGIRGQDNPYEYSDLSEKAHSLMKQNFKEIVHTHTRLKKRWVVLRYPNAVMATVAGQSVESFEDFYFKVCNLDYKRMSNAMNALVKLMEKTEKVRILGPSDTDIQFSINGIPAIKCDGKMNLPDGEVYTAPVRDSVNGKISYNTSSFLEGSSFSNISLEVKNGKIIDVKCPDNQDKAEEIFNTDEGSRYFGEFAIGVNPHILHPINDILFDEKICGSIHLTPGNAYDEAFNGNKSKIHWDLVLIQRKEYGGGEIYFDDKLIRKDGLFVTPELEPLNPENLV